MEKIKLLCLAASIAVIVPSAAYSADFGGGINPANLNGINTMQGGLNVHDIQMIKEQEFRHREYNENKDMRAQKEAKHKKDVIENAPEDIQQIRHKIRNSDNAQIIQQNGEIRIEHMD